MTTYFRNPSQTTNNKLADDLDKLKQREEAIENRQEILEQELEKEEKKEAGVLFMSGLHRGVEDAKNKKDERRRKTDEDKETQAAVEEDKDREDEHIKEAA